MPIEDECNYTNSVKRLIVNIRRIPMPKTNYVFPDPIGTVPVFVGGCVERGDGSMFRRKAHAHNQKKDPNFGTICVLSAKRLYTPSGNVSNLMWHEVAHILTPNHGHDDKFRAKLKEIMKYKETK
jgi:hypothetical protein